MVLGLRPRCVGFSLLELEVASIGEETWFPKTHGSGRHWYVWGKCFSGADPRAGNRANMGWEKRQEVWVVVCLRGVLFVCLIYGFRMCLELVAVVEKEVKGSNSKRGPEERHHADREADGGGVYRSICWSRGSVDMLCQAGVWGGTDMLCLPESLCGIQWVQMISGRPCGWAGQGGTHPVLRRLKQKDFKL